MSCKLTDEIAEERKRQDEKWGVQNHDPVWWLVILGEEVGEAARAVLEGSGLNYRQELIHAAAVIMAAIESLERENCGLNSLVRLQNENKRLREAIKETPDA